MQSLEDWADIICGPQTQAEALQAKFNTYGEPADGLQFCEWVGDDDAVVALETNGIAVQFPDGSTWYSSSRKD